MKNNKLIAVATAMIMYSGVLPGAIAEGSKKHNFYVGVGAGQSGADDICRGDSDCDDSDTGWKIFGGYNINKYWSAELEYIDFQQIYDIDDGFDTKADAHALNVSVVGSIPIAGDFSAFAKAGVYYADVDTSDNVDEAEDETTTGFSYGVGVKYNINDRVSIRGEWQQLENAEFVYSDSADTIFESNLDLLSISAVINF